MTFLKSISALIIFSILISCNAGKKIKNSNTTTNTPLQETYWKLTEMNGQAVTTPENAKEIHIKFRKDGNKFQGFAGCNTLMGKFELLPLSKITISAGSTRMFCDRMETENQLNKVLSEADSYLITNDTLQLYKGKMATLAVFKAVYF